MKMLRILRRLGIVLTVFGLYGCSTIKSWFPDKEKDYQFTSEIPELVVPNDLKNKGLASPEPGAVASATSESDRETVPNEDSTARNDQPVSAEAVEPEQEPKQERNAAQSEARSGNEVAVSSLEIDQAQASATRMVGRALSRKQMEIVERNIDKGYFYVKFDPNAVEAKDDSLWDEFVFMFGDDPSHEEEYRITVHQIGVEASEVTIQDGRGKTISNSVANALLKLITDGINEVVKEEDEAESSPTETKEQAVPASAAESE